MTDDFPPLLKVIFDELERDWLYGKGDGKPVGILSSSIKEGATMTTAIIDTDLKELHWEAVRLVDCLYRQGAHHTRPALIDRARARARRRFDKAYPTMTIWDGAKKSEG